MLYEKSFICDPMIFLTDLNLWNSYKEQRFYNCHYELYSWLSLRSFLLEHPTYITSTYKCRSFRTRIGQNDETEFHGDGVYRSNLDEMVTSFSGWLGLFQYNKNDYDMWFINNRKNCKSFLFIDSA